MSYKNIFQAVVFFILSAELICAQNLIVNPGFESPGVGARITDWSQVEGWSGPDEENSGVDNKEFYSPLEGRWYAFQQGSSGYVTQQTGHVISAGERYVLTLWARSINQPKIKSETPIEVRLSYGDVTLASVSAQLNAPKLKGLAAITPNDDGANVWVDGKYRHEFADVHLYQPVESDPLNDPWSKVQNSGYDSISSELGWAVGNIIVGANKFIFGTLYRDRGPDYYSSITMTKALRSSGPAYSWSKPVTILSHTGTEFPWVEDPHVFYDESTGRLWMAWGGGVCFVSELDPNDGMLISHPDDPEFDTHPANIHTPAATWPETDNGWCGDEWSKCWMEGAAIYKHNGYWYYFGSYGNLSADYTIRVGRGNSPTGPFYDKRGIDMMKFDSVRNKYGNSILLGAEGRQLVPGHPHIWTEKGKYYLGYDFRVTGEGTDYMGIRRLYWVDDWPTIYTPITVTVNADDFPDAIGQKLSVSFQNTGSTGSWLAVDSVSLRVLSATGIGKAGINKPIDFEKNVMIPMRDGVELTANITLPGGDGSFPVILVRTPYGKDNGEDDAGVHWAEKGYVFVIQDCRGTGNSDGKWYPVVNERSDGIDTRNWLLKQKWCNGNIGTTGGSYLGLTQFASAIDSTESLKAMFPIIPMMDSYYGISYIGGALGLGTSLGWGLSMARPTEGEDALIDEESWDWGKAFKKLPLIDFDQNIGVKLPWMRDWVKHPNYSDYWKSLNLDEIKRKCNIPMITTSGWYDIFLSQALNYFSDAIENGKNNQYLIVGPWGHGPNYPAGERKPGENHILNLDSLEMNWFNYFLKGENVGIDLPPIKLYVMGKNYWRDEYEWPLKRTEYIKYYFESEGEANSLFGDGKLTVRIPSGISYDKFKYNPEIPVPTKGGSILFDVFGAFDQREIETRNDVLVYTTEVLKEEIEVTGWIKAVVFAETDSKDTDWTAKLLDVYPDGRAFNLCDGIIRARYRKNRVKQVLIEPGKIYKYNIDMWATSNVFLTGHRIRVEISSSNFPRFDRNPNTGHEFGMDSELKVAKQKIYHSKKYPSHIVLPVIPRGT